MKKIFTLLTMLLSLFMTSEIMASNNQVTSKYVGCTSINGRGVATFIVTSPEPQMCYLSFLIMPGEYLDGTFTTVTISVNGIRRVEPIFFSTYGWQFAYLRGDFVNLNAGDNIIQFISGRDDVPQIKEVNILDDNTTNPFIHNLMSTTSNVEEVINENEQEDDLNSHDFQRYIYSNSNRPLYRPGIESLIKYVYTPIIDLYITHKIDPNTGERLPLIVDLIAPISSNLNDQYESTIDYNAYLFYKSDPSVYSKSFYTENHHFFCLDNRLPTEGEYCLILEPKSSYMSGFATIIVNDVIYQHCYMYPNMTVEVKRKDEANNIFISSQDSIFNMFTTNHLYTDTITHTPDPILYLKQRVITGQDTSSIIVAYNDDNNVETTFDWKKNARIRTKLDSTKQYFITTCSSLPYIHRTNVDACVLYHSYWNNIDTTQYMEIALHDISYYDIIDGDSVLVNFNAGDTIKYFSKLYPNLKAEDLIESDIASENYNCYAWSAGMIYKFLPRFSVEEFDLLYSNQEVVTTRGRYKRPSQFPIYTRDNATYENAVVDLWGYINTRTNEYIIEHATVKNPYSGIPNGYDWESKDGYRSRFFHPRMADLGYNNLLIHYTLAPGQENIKYSYEGIIYSSIAEGEMIIEDVQLTEDEKSLLSQNISTVSTYEINRFEQYYNQWREYAKTKLHYSDLEYYKDSIVYPCLVDYILSNPGEEYKVYKKFDEGDYFAAVLIKDISSVEDTRAKKVWDKIMNAPLENDIVRTSWGDIRLFIKTMLQDESIETLPQTGKTRSNEDNVEIIAINNGVKITIGFDKISTYSIKAINMQTTQELQLHTKSNHQEGSEIHEYQLPKGIYVIAVIINENINAQKIIVK